MPVREGRGATLNVIATPARTTATPAHSGGLTFVQINSSGIFAAAGHFCLPPDGIQRRSQKAPSAGALWKPSDGLEPSTPSLPWRCSTN